MLVAVCTPSRLDFKSFTTWKWRKKLLSWSQFIRFATTSDIKSCGNQIWVEILNIDDQWSQEEMGWRQKKSNSFSVQKIFQPNINSHTSEDEFIDIFTTWRIMTTETKVHLIDSIWKWNAEKILVFLYFDDTQKWSYFLREEKKKS